MTFSRLFHQFRAIPPGPAARPGGPAPARGDRLIAYEVAGTERTYPWARSRRDEPFEWVTLFPDRVLETIEPDACRWAMIEALEHDRPDALGIVGYARPESIAAARWAAASPASDDPDVREPGDRPAARLVEGADQAAAGPPVRRGRRRRPGAPRIPGAARACRRIASPWDTTPSTTPTSPRRPGDGATIPPGARACPRPLFPDRLPVRAREEPRAAGRGVRPLSTLAAPRPALGPGALRRRAGPGRGRGGRRGQRARPSHPPARASSRSTNCPAGTPTPVRSCCPACWSPGGSSPTRPRPAGCPWWSRDRAGCAATLVPDPPRDHRCPLRSRWTSMSWPRRSRGSPIVDRRSRSRRWAAARPRSSRSGGRAGSPTASSRPSNSPGIDGPRARAIGHPWSASESR